MLSEIDKYDKETKRIASLNLILACYLIVVFVFILYNTLSLIEKASQGNLCNVENYHCNGGQLVFTGKCECRYDALKNK